MNFKIFSPESGGKVDGNLSLRSLVAIAHHFLLVMELACESTRGGGAHIWRVTWEFFFSLYFFSFLRKKSGRLSSNFSSLIKKNWLLLWEKCIHHKIPKFCFSFIKFSCQLFFFHHVSCQFSSVELIAFPVSRTKFMSHGWSCYHFQFHSLLFHL